MKISQRIAHLEESATLAVSAKAAKMQAEGIDVISFGAGEPDFPTPPHIAEAAIQAIRAGKTKYSKPTSGSAAVKKAVCEKLARENNLRYQPDQVVVDAGGKMTVYLAIHTVIDPGDEVVIPVPYWVSYPPIVQLAGGTPVFVTGPREKDYKLTPQLLESVLTPRTRMVVLNSPSNPSGVTYDPHEIRALAHVLEPRDLVVLSDEIYDQLVFENRTALSYASVSPRAYEQTITLNAASKTYSMTGWRIGYAAGPKPIIQGMIKLQTQTTSGAATFTQEALATALIADQSEVQRMRNEFAKRALHMWERLCAMPGVTCPKPTGAFYCFPDVSKTFQRLGVNGSIAWADRLLSEARVAVVPGIGFGLDEHVRLSFACDHRHADEGLRRIEEFLRKS